MLTETRSRHFSEGLFYADNLPEEYVSACYNGSISAVRTSWADTVSTFAYSYDPQNRLLSSNRVTHSSQALSERFTYDPEGNILSLKRYSGNRKIDDLTYSYDSDGNRLISVVDNGQDADLYSTIEYHYSEAQADTTMCYDANGNLIWDLDRGITAIKYNILNLPDTILFANGNRIINLYDAAGRKYKSIVHTNIAAAVTSSYDLEHAAFEPDSVEYCITEYAGNVETIYTPRDTTRRIFNTIGYRADNAYYYFIKDHLGNICAVVNATADTVVQRTMYYASGVPMAQSWGRDTQPYLYNGKELVEAHGWNTFDYGFRGYYAPIARFTSIDPLAEQTPWQSPYAYAGNNFINVIDWMGLSSMMNFTTPHFIVVDLGGNVIGGIDDNDHNIYIDLDGDWDEDDGMDGLIWVCEMEYEHAWYFNGSGNGRSNVVTSGQIKTAIGRSLIADVALGIADSYLREVLGKAIGPIGDKTTKVVYYTRAVQSAYDIFESFLTKGYNNQAAYNAAKDALAFGIKYAFDKGAVKAIERATTLAPKVATTATALGPYILGTAIGIIAGWAYYKAGEYFINMTWTLDRTLNSKGFWANLGGFNYDGSDW